MSVNLEDYCRIVFEEQLSKQLLPQQDDVTYGVTRLLEKREEIRRVDAALRGQHQEFEKKRESLQQRRDELKTKEEKLKESLLKFDKFVKENDAKRARCIKKAQAERCVVREREKELQLLHTHIATLLAKREQLQNRVGRAKKYCQFLDSVLKTSKKFEDASQLIGRFDTLVSTRKLLLEHQSTVESERERKTLEMRRYVSERSSVLLHYNNTLSQLQTELDSLHSQALRWEANWNHIQTTAAKETLLLGQLKYVTLNLYQMIGGVTSGGEGVDVDDTLGQLERIQLYIQDRAAIVHDLRSDTENNTFKPSEQE